MFRTDKVSNPIFIREYTEYTKSRSLTIHINVHVSKRVCESAELSVRVFVGTSMCVKE